MVNVVGKTRSSQRRRTTNAGHGRRHIAGGLLLPAVLSIATTLTIAGCERDAPTSSPAPSGPPIAIRLDTPQDATRTLLLLLRGQLQARAAGDKATAEAHGARLVQDVIARDHILTRYSAVVIRAPADKVALLKTLVKNWGSIISYYADGLALDRVQSTVVGGAGRGAVVGVPAQGRDDQTIVRVLCLRDPEGHWRVTGLELAPPSAASRPAVPGH